MKESVEQKKVLAERKDISSLVYLRNSVNILKDLHNFKKFAPSKVYIVQLLV